MKYAIIILLTITGCTTPYDLKRTIPYVTYSTSRPAKDVKKCILDKWRLHLNSVYEEKTDQGFLVRFNDVLESNTVSIATIDQMDDETKVNYYSRSKVIRHRRLEDEVLECK